MWYQRAFDVLTHIHTHRLVIKWSELLKGHEGDREDAGRCYVGVYSLMVFSLLLSSLFHLSGGLMGADLTTGAGTSAGKNTLVLSHTLVC